MATIRDVAQLAGVSIATVSHVLNNTRTVRPETRQLVVDAIARLHYQPNAVARSLATSTTYTVAVLVADITNAFSGSLVRGIEDRLSAQDYNLIVCNTDEHVEREARYLELLLAKQVDGVMIASTGAPQPIFHQFISRNIPLVFVDRQPPEPCGPWIGIDNGAAGYTATDYLIRLGHRRIAIIARRPALSTVVGRLSGYRQALSDHGLPVDERLVAICDPTPDAACAAAVQLLNLTHRPTAVVATNHIMTLGVLSAIQQRNLACPAEISVVCFDDHPWAPLFTPPLTVMRQPLAEMCDAVISTLLVAIARRNENRRGGNNLSRDRLPDVLLNAELVVRGSCRSLETCVCVG